MNIHEIVDTIATKHGLTKATSKTIVEDVLEAIIASAVKGEEVSFNGFGKFKVKQSPARDGRNPASGEPISIAAAKKLTFAPAKAVKDRLNG